MDVTAETFLIAWRRLDDVPADPAAWLFGVARKVIAGQNCARTHGGTHCTTGSPPVRPLFCRPIRRTLAGWNRDDTRIGLVLTGMIDVVDEPAVPPGATGQPGRERAAGICSLP
jgi:hypothetical protein